MTAEPTPGRWSLIKDVLLLQLKLLLGAARDLALTPLTLAAAALDLILAGRQTPRFFHLVLRLGERSDHWIDLWSAVRSAQDPQRENVEMLLVRVGDVVRDPQSGARRARVLKRWAERQLRSRQRLRADGRADATDDKTGAPQ